MDNLIKITEKQAEELMKIREKDRPAHLAWLQHERPKHLGAYKDLLEIVERVYKRGFNKGREHG